MADFLSKKMKRKELEDVYDDFSDFSLSSPARKIRRLGFLKDAELPPIVEEEESAIPLDLDPPLQEEMLPSAFANEAVSSSNEERALVLYKPVTTSLWEHSNVSITVNQDLIRGFKDGPFWSERSNLLKSTEEQQESNDQNAASDNRLAVVPWVSYQLASAPTVEPPVMTELSDPMEADDVEYGTMDVEEDVGPRINETSGGLFQQWQQQHCMTPQVPPNTATTPVMWSW